MTAPTEEDVLEFCRRNGIPEPYPFQVQMIRAMLDRATFTVFEGGRRSGRTYVRKVAQKLGEELGIVDDLGQWV